MLGRLKQHWNVLGKTGSTLPPWCISPRRPSTTPPPAWVKNYCIWCNLMDCWTVNMLDSQTAVLPRVKCDGWAGGSRGTYGNDQAWKERVILCAFVSLTSDHTEEFVCFSFVSLLATSYPVDQYPQFPPSKSDFREIHPGKCFNLDVCNIDRYCGRVNSLECIYHAFQWHLLPPGRGAGQVRAACRVVSAETAVPDGDWQRGSPAHTDWQLSIIPR